jgi:hypothetical protein
MFCLEASNLDLDSVCEGQGGHSQRVDLEDRTFVRLQGLIQGIGPLLGPCLAYSTHSDNVLRVLVQVYRSMTLASLLVTARKGKTVFTDLSNDCEHEFCFSPFCCHLARGFRHGEPAPCQVIERNPLVLRHLCREIVHAYYLLISTLESWIDRY